MKGVYFKGGGRVKWVYLPDAMRGGVLGVYADEDGGGEFARVCDDERKAEAFFKRETENGNGVYYSRVWSAETPRRVVAVGD